MAKLNCSLKARKESKRMNSYLLSTYCVQELCEVLKMWRWEKILRMNYRCLKSSQKLLRLENSLWPLDNRDGEKWLLLWVCVSREGKKILFRTNGFCNVQNNNNIKAKGSESKKGPGNIIPGDLIPSRYGVTCQWISILCLMGWLVKEKQWEWGIQFRNMHSLHYINMVSLNPKRK